MNTKWVSSAKYWLLVGILTVFAGIATASGSIWAYAGEWVATGDDSDCADNQRCAQWCQRAATGEMVPSGIFCCLPETAIGSHLFGACRSPR